MLVRPRAHEPGGRDRVQAAGVHLRHERREPRAPGAATVDRVLDEVAALELAELPAVGQLHRAGDRRRTGRLAEHLLREREAVAGGRVVEVAVYAEASRCLGELAARADPADRTARLEAWHH